MGARPEAVKFPSNALCFSPGALIRLSPAHQSRSALRPIPVIGAIIAGAKSGRDQVARLPAGLRLYVCHPLMPLGCRNRLYAQFVTSVGQRLKADRGRAAPWKVEAETGEVGGRRSR